MKLKVLFLFLFALILMQNLTAKDKAADFAVFDAQGKSASIEEMIMQLKDVDVLFLGEYHDDSVAHRLQSEIFKEAFEKYNKNRKIALSLEMFERDVQIILDEYLADLITEKHFLDSSRPWGNYKTDYRPLVEFAKQNKLNVIAANAPRRYVNMVSRMGRDSLNQISPDAKKWLPPLPFPKSSKAYADKFNARMMGHGSEKILQSQTLWDASMAYSISEHLRQTNDNLIVHLNGSFHTENRLGTVEQLLHYKPKTRILVVSMLYEKEYTKFDKTKHLNLGDYVILTDSAKPRSKR